MGAHMTSPLFQPCALGHLQLKNRIWMSAAATWPTTAAGDIIADQPLLHYDVARGGTALVITGGVTVHASSRHAPTAAVLDDDRRIPSFRVFADRVHAGGAAVALQVTHAGLWAAEYQLERGGRPLMPSFYVEAPLFDYPAPRRHELPASGDQVREVVAAYADAARRAQQAGYDAVEVHGAHDSLLAQFLSPYTNLRTDEWGGTVANRCRIHRDILTAIRAQVGPDFPVVLKLGVADCLPGGLALAEGLAAADLIARAGAVTAIEVSQGLTDISEKFQGMSLKPGITSRDKEAYFRPWTQRVTAALQGTGVQVVMQGGLRSPNLMEDVLLKNEADFVSMCRPYICEPGLVNRWQAGDLARARCVSCNQCLLRAQSAGNALRCVLPPA